MLNAGVQLHPVGFLCRCNKPSLGQYMENVCLYDGRNRNRTLSCRKQGHVGLDERAWLQNHRLGETKYERMERKINTTITLPSDQQLETARQIFESAGLSAVIGG